LQVGKVSGFGGSLGNLMLVPVAEYPLHEYSEDEGEEFAQQEDIYLPPYNPDGSLEVVSPFLFLLLSIFSPLLFFPLRSGILLPCASK